MCYNTHIARDIIFNNHRISSLKDVYTHTQSPRSISRGYILLPATLIPSSTNNLFHVECQVKSEGVGAP